MLNYDDVSGMYYVFTGSNVITGKPNCLTGKFSYSGFYQCFRTKEEARIYALDQSKYFSVSYYGTAKSLRKHSLGMSVNDYIEHLLCLPFGES